MKYFSYQPERTNVTMIGTDREQIKSTLAHYKFEIPDETDIRQLARVKVMCAMGIPRTNHFFYAEIREHVLFQVHANAFQYIREIGNNFGHLKRGGLYKFDPGRRDYGLLFLPEHIMRGLDEYDWSRHRAQVEEWMKDEKKIKPPSVETGRFFVKPS